MMIVRLIKVLIVVFAVLGGANMYFFSFFVQANDKIVWAHEMRRAFILADHELRMASLELTRLVRSYIVMGVESQLELYWEELLIRDRMGSVRQAFIDNDASLPEMFLLGRALAYQGRLRSIEALAIELRAAGESQMALDLTYGTMHAAYGIAFVNVLDELSAATFARTQKIVDRAQNNALMFGRLALAVAVLLVLVIIAGTVLILREVKATMGREREANEINEIFLKSSPFIMNIWDDAYKLVSTSSQSVKMFGLSSQEQYMERFHDLSPKYQPCGTLSQKKAIDCVRKAFSEGHAKFEWMHQTLSGEPLPAEVTLERFTRQGKQMVAAYTVDLRPVKAAIEEKRQAEDESKAKTRFLARMSHEIRTPMNAVLGIARIQLQKEGHPPETEDAFSRIYNSADMLLHIINDILDFSRVEAGKMEIIPAAYETASLIVDTIQLNLMYIGSKKIDFKLSLDWRLPVYLIGDMLRIKQILNNLLSNAFKYTQEGRVALSFGMEEASEPDDIILLIGVSDTGRGMSKEQLDRLFDEFDRFNLQENSAIEGSGLGMPIAYSLINMMQGTINVKSDPGNGTVFTVRLPQKTHGIDVLGEEMASDLQNLEAGRVPLKESVKKVSKFDHEPMPYGRVLVVDDVDINLYVVEGILASYEIAVETATSGSEAIGKIRNGEVYDIVFMDHMMPGMDGVEATKIIRGMGYAKPIVALTANALKDTEKMFMENGFSGFVSKPIDVDKLDKYLMRFIRDRKFAPKS